jgi:beta-glucuronidase
LGEANGEPPVDVLDSSAMMRLYFHGLEGGDMGTEEADGISRREFLKGVGMASGAAAAGAGALSGASAGEAWPAFKPPADEVKPRLSAAMRPQQNEFRNVMDLSGLWQFQLDPKGEGEQAGWNHALPLPRPIPVPASWNDLFDDAANYLGYGWYEQECWIPKTWSGQKIFLRVYSANYAARVWLNGEHVGDHEGGHLPFAFEITGKARFDQPNLITIRVENLQKPDRVPPGPAPGHGGGFINSYPATTYDFFPYAGIHRQVALYTCPSTHLEDVTVTTAIDGQDGMVKLRARASGGWSGKGKAELAPGYGGAAGTLAVDMDFTAGEASAGLRVPSARFWTPDHPHLYPLTISLLDSSGAIDRYTLEVGVRTVEVRGDRLLLNNQPIVLRGFGKHEDFPLHGKGLDLAQLVRDYQLLKWVGANAYRTSHYPYSEEAMELADRIGILIIDEIPAVGLNFAESEETIHAWSAMAQSQLRDLIARDKNHPSVIMWSVANEPGLGSPLSSAPHKPQAVAAGSSYFHTMVGLAHQLDSTRPVTFAGVQGGPNDWLGLVDVTSINRYYGWYTEGAQLEAATESLAKDLDALHATLAKPMILTEFGAEGLPGWHSQPPEMWTEDYQAELIGRYLEVARERPFMAGTLVWCFADFKTSQSIIRAESLNSKGVFTRDRRPKRAAHLLRSRWHGSKPEGA